MPRRSKQGELETIRVKLLDLLVNFKKELQSPNLRTKVQALIPAYHFLRDLGSSLIPSKQAASARDRILFYLRKYPRSVVEGDELMVVSGIGEWARRLRELRVQFGWWIYSGVTFGDMVEDARNAGDEAELASLGSTLGIDPSKIRPDQYVLMRPDQDRQAAYRWNVLNEIRKKDVSVMNKIIAYFRKNVGQQITGEELKYLAKDKKEWARRVRELRTEQGWPIVTKNSGRDDLSVGVYVLEEDRQAYEHDRSIPDPIRVAVLQRDGFKCVDCGWHRGLLSPDDPRKMLELHHRQHHKDKGGNTIDNLLTLCNVHHDEQHRKTPRSK
jgi:5-methylcytosine-specific restriction endonuclease McrA